MWGYIRIGRIGHVSWKGKTKNKSSAREIGNETRITERGEDSTMKEGRVESKRARGRQRYIWENNIKRWTGNSLTECTNGTRDRQ
jgi:hypothetical protein